MRIAKKVFIACCVILLFNSSAVLAEGQERWNPYGFFTIPGPSNLRSSCDFQKAREKVLHEAQAMKESIEYDDTIVQYIEPMRQKDGSLIPRKCGNKGGRCYDYRSREIPLWFLNTETCEMVSTTITRRINSKGLPVLANNEDGTDVELEEGPYGRVWNGYNTAYIVPGEPLVPLLGLWKSSRRGSDPISYTPHSLRVREFFPGFAECGAKHIKKDLKVAISDLRAKQVISRAIPDVLVADVAEKYFMDIAILIPWIEQTDHRWFEEFEEGNEKFNPFRRAAEVVCMNGDDAYDLTRSMVGASGITQIYPPTCHKMLRKLYPEAELPLGCGYSEDSPFHGHVESLKATILHLDSTFNDFILAEKEIGFFGFITRNYVNFTAPLRYRFSRDLVEGVRGKDVALLQEYLGIEADGVFGPLTKQAVSEYQREHLHDALGVLSEYSPFMDDLGERQIAAYNGYVGRVILATRTYLDKWSEVHLRRDAQGKLFTPRYSLVYETSIYVRIFKHIRDNPEVLYKD